MHLDIWTWPAVSIGLQSLYLRPYMMCTSTGTFAVTSVCSCSQLQDLASQNIANRIATMAACVFRLCVGRGMVVSVACSCVWGSKGAFRSTGAFSDNVESMSAYVDSFSAIDFPTVSWLSGADDTKGLGELAACKLAKCGCGVIRH